MAAKVLRLCCVWLLLVAEVVRCVEHRVPWTVAGVAQYRDNPLVVHLSDTLPESDVLILQCEPGNFSNILEVNSHEEFNICDSRSSGQATSVGECHGNFQEIRYPITQNSGNLDGVVDFRVGVTVYFASYSDGRGLLSVTSNLTKGGQCLMGLKLAVRVVDPTVTTPPPTTAAPTTATTPPSTATTSQSNSQSSSPPPIFNTRAPQPTFSSPVTGGIISGAVTLQAHLATTVTIFVCTLIAAALR